MITMPQPVQLRFTVDDYHRMIELGRLKDCEKTEIIEGKLIKKSTAGDRHAATVNFLAKFFIKKVPDDILVRVQNPVRISDYNEPEPDLVLADLNKFDGRRHPRPAEVLLLIEVSDSTIRYDREIKILLYAEAKIPEVWIINLPHQLIEVHTRPNFGIYQSVRIYTVGEVVVSDAVPNLSLSVKDLLS